MAKSARDKMRDATFDSSMRGAVNKTTFAKGVQPASKDTAPSGNRKAASMSSKGTKATGKGSSKSNPIPKGR